MVIKIDLRIIEKTKSRSEAETGLPHYFVFAAAAAFMLTVIAVLLLGAWNVYSLRGDKDEIIAQKNSITSNLSVMDMEYTRLSGEAGEHGTKLNYMLDDIPSIEILTALDSLLPNGTVIESLTISGGKAVFKGVALKEDDALQFVNKLSTAPFASSVDVADITASRVKGASAKAFSVTCTLRPLREILATSAFDQAKTVEISGDAAENADAGKEDGAE